MGAPVLGSFRVCGIAAALVLAHALAASLSGAASANPWTFSASAGVRTSFDSNVLLQDFGDQAKREAWVNSLTALFALTYQPTPQMKALVSYAPEATFFDGQSTEDHFIHRAALNLSGQSGDTAWEWLNSVTRIDGDNLGPRFTLDGGTRAAQIPAIGGVPIRDRRDAAIFRNSFKLTQTFGEVFVRPVAAFYHHNFMTGQRAPVGDFLGYQNYIDRQDLGGGFDVGFQAWSGTWLVAGFRAGEQKQDDLLDVSSPYGNHYYRVLMGVEGTPVPWLKLNLLAGPDFRDFNSGTPSGFDANKAYTFIDATATLTLTKADSVTLGMKRHLQPSYASLSVYEDIVYEGTYRHQFDPRLTAAAGFKAYNAKWRPPVQRDEWVFTPSFSLTYTHRANLTAELAYSYDWAKSDIPNTEGREYTRHLVGLGLKYTF